ncbi:type II secretion system F family protein [Patescibacteria group bacterium]|nr:type II secretion system F family protein [Patescibacteria group bacterium]
MPKYLYKAKNEKEEEVDGEMTVDNEDVLKQRLGEKGLELIEQQESKNGKVKFTFSEKMSNVTHIDKIFFTQNLEVMIRTGFSVSVALGAIAEQTTNTKFKKIIKDIKQNVESGITLSKSLRIYPKVFPAIFINMIEAGEISGKLEQILKRLTIQMKKDNTLRSKVRGAMIYPVIIIVAMLGIGIFSMIFVIPKITAIYEEVNADLPVITEVLIVSSKFMANNTLIFLVSLVLIIVGFQRYVNSKKGRHVWHKLQLKLPIAGPIIKKINLARFSRTLSSLLQTDIPIVKSFNIIAETLTNVIYHDFVISAGKGLEKGEPLKKILKQDPGLFPAVVTQMISVGEESGTLDTIVEEVANFYEEDIDQTMANLTVIIEPILMIILGVGVGGIAAAIIMPMYNISAAI